MLDLVRTRELVCIQNLEKVTAKGIFEDKKTIYDIWMTE
jgi:hypothetical protein